MNNVKDLEDAETKQIIPEEWSMQFVENRGGGGRCLHDRRCFYLCSNCVGSRRDYWRNSLRDGMRKCGQSRRTLTVFFLACMIAAGLIGCGKADSADQSKQETVLTGTAEVIDQTDAELTQEEEAKDSNSTEKDESTKKGDGANQNQNIEAEGTDQEKGSAEECEGKGKQDTEGTADTADTADTEVNPDTFIIHIENPSWKYYLSDQAVMQSLPGYTLDKQTQESNEITDDTDWFIENGLSYPGRSYTIGTYSYELGEWKDEDSLSVSVTEWATAQTFVYVLEDYKWAPDINERYEDFTDQRVIYALAEDGVLYVSTGHNTYADACEETAYITAIDMSTNTVLWKSTPLVCNARSFAIVDDYIVCGYGFTKEDDYLNVLRRDNGVLQEQFPLKSAPYYIFLKDGILYVRCYDTNYTFQMAMG